LEDRPHVALVNMPFGHSKYPSIQLGTLSALLKSQGIGVTGHYLNLLFAHKIGLPLYERLCEKRALFGEWLFSHLLFRENPKHADYVRTFKPVFEDIAKESGHPVGYFEDLASRIAPQFLTWAMTAIDWGQYKMVGFTSTFDQNVASLSMAKLIKDLYPGVQIVFGGANFDGDMGMEHFRAFPWIDYVVVGEGEEVFPALVKQVLAGRNEPPPKGVIHRKDGRICFEPNPSLFSNFQQTGPPDYDDYFRQLAELGAGPSQGLDRVLLYEGSRGCWWGEKHHCTFCGLNAQSMKFRAKSPEQVAQELDALSSRYDSTRFRLVDNIIDMKYVDDLFGKFAEDHLDLDVFVETKSNLSKRQIQTLAQGGVKCMQPGIESLSHAQLREMDKGVSPMQNLQCLKWSLYYHIDISWNILLGFPQETDEDYRRQIDLIPSILHLQPPEAVGKFWLERFSPYFTRPAQYGIRITGPGMAYEYVYDARAVDLSKIAYDFEYEN
jgi:ribosomal peptide maturation radical SAM protein 1